MLEHILSLVLPLPFAVLNHKAKLVFRRRRIQYLLVPLQTLGAESARVPKLHF